MFDEFIVILLICHLSSTAGIT